MFMLRNERISILEFMEFLCEMRWLSKIFALKLYLYDEYFYGAMFMDPCLRNSSYQNILI